MISPRNPSAFPRTRTRSRRQRTLSGRPTLLVTVGLATVFLGLLALSQRDGCANPSYAQYMGSQTCPVRFTQ